MKRTLARMRRNHADADALAGCDVTIDVTMKDVPAFARRLSCPAEMPLNVFQDRVLTPTLGFCRNYHAHQFHSGIDGAVFGPTDSNAIDMMHCYRETHKMFSDKKFRVCDVLSKVGDKMTYIYDLGDRFTFIIELKSVTPLAVVRCCVLCIDLPILTRLFL
jgi:hypothetical protein